MGRFGKLFSGFRTSRGAPSERAEENARGGPQWVVAGLGNPEGRWAHSRHNVGFMVIDRIAREAGAALDRRSFNGLCAEVELAGARTMLVKPQTYYNLSGECVAAILGYYKIPVARLIVVHDDLDLEAGQLRLKRGGGDAGNRGVRSIAEVLKTPDFVRVRVGIGRPAPNEESKDYVLRPLGRTDAEIIEAAVARATDAAPAIIADGLERAMNRYNQRA